MSSESQPIDPTTLQETFQNLMKQIKTYYVYPEIADQICSRLQQYFEQGVYDEIYEGEFLALALTLHMQEVSQDKHMWVKWYPQELPEQTGSILNHPEFLAQKKQGARLANFGLHKVERMPGNVGYIDIRYFYRTSWGSGDTIVAAMSFLANSNAVIIDLRQCKGGFPGTVAMVCSFFFGEEPIHLNSLHWRENDLTEQYWTLPYLPGKRMLEQPVFILTSKDTFSGGEELAYNLKTQQRATLVGEPTGGGAHPGSTYRIHPHFEVFIPNGYAINPITKDNWEGSGVQPDVPIAQEHALNAAYRLALNSIIESLGAPASPAWIDYLAEVQGALQKINNDHLLAKESCL